MKKYLSKLSAVVLCLALLLSSSWIFATSAEDSVSTDPTLKFSVVTEKITDKEGTDVSIDVSVANNPGISNINFQVKYPAELELVSVVATNAMYSGSLSTLYSRNPYTLNLGNLMDPNPSNYEDDGKLVTLNFRLKSDITFGDYDIQITNLRVAKWNSSAYDNLSDSFKTDIDTITVSHEYPSEPTQKATCEEDGYYECVNCGEKITIPKTGHNWEAGLGEDATCEEDGYTEYYCLNDPTHTYRDTITKLGHNYELKSTTPATYLEAGNNHYVCSRDESHTMDEPIAKLIDNDAPTGKISIDSENWWNKLLSTITFGIYKKQVTFSITEVSDTGAGVDSVSYYVSNKSLTEDQVKAISEWNAYSTAVPISEDGNYVIYAKIADKSIDNNGGANVTYISTDGLVIDTAAPVVGVAAAGGDGTNYCENTTVTVTDANIDTVTVKVSKDGGAQYNQALTDGKFVLNDKGTYVITATDKAGNASAGKTVVINGAHIFGNWIVDSEADYYKAGSRHKVCSVCGSIETETLDKLIDNSAPTGTVTVKENSWREFINSVTFGLFYKETLDVTIDSADVGTGVKSVQYYVAETGLTKADVAGLSSWTDYSGKFSLSDSKDYVVYAKISDGSIDNNGGANVTYISSDGFVIDKNAPVISGVAEANDYFGDKTFTVSESNLDYVKVDGNKVSLSADGSYTIPADNGSHNVEVKDKAGNTASVAFNVYKNYTVTFKVDGSVYKTLTVGHGKAADVPTIPTKTGYTDVAPKWDVADSALANVTGNITANAVYTANKYTATLNNATGYTLSSNNGTTVAYDDTYTFTLSVADGYSKTDSFAVKVNGKAVSGSGDTYSVKVSGDVNITVEGIADITAPTAEIKVGDNKWAKLLSKITFGYFFKATQTVSITAADAGSGVKEIKYHIASKQMTEAQLDALSASDWNSYSVTFNIDPNNEYVIYAAAVDNAGNKVYVSSDGLVLDNVAPVVTGIKDGEVYCKTSVTATVTGENYEVTVTSNGNKVAVTNNEFTLTKGDNQKIVITDKSGNTTELTVTVVGTGHIVSNWNVNKEASETENGEKTGVCDNCGETVTVETGKLTTNITSTDDSDLAASVSGVDGTTFNENAKVILKDVTATSTDAEKAAIGKDISDIAGDREIASIISLDFSIFEKTDADEDMAPVDYEPEGEFTVTADIPSYLTAKYKSLKLIKIDDSGKAEEVSFKIENGKAVFAASSSGKYVFVGNPVSTEPSQTGNNTTDGTKSPATADSLMLTIILIIALALSALFIVMRKRKFSK